MGIIRELPPSVVNQIAAGEVVERPASVVKELLENAIDAGATRVELTVERGGKDLVRVTDDGKGMDRADMQLAFQPHATSKLETADDLFRIRTLGFRGEALAAIAEVSRVRCQSRPADAASGAELLIEGGSFTPIKECGRAPGTVMEVRNLFYNVPVRRAFLKSDQTEAGHVVEAFIRIALAHPTVQLTYKSGNKVVYDLPAETGVKGRIATFLGQDLADSLIWVENQVGTVRLWGYVAHPSQSRPSAKGQYFFVGGRCVRDRSLSHALSEAYRGLLMVGRLPVAFLYLDLPAEDVDVNVHPSKIEVRFRDGGRVYSQLLATLRQTFLGSDLHARLQAHDPPSDSTNIPPAGSAAPIRSFDLTPASPDRQEVARWFEPARSGGPPTTTTPSTGVIGMSRVPDWSNRLPAIQPSFESAPFDEIEAAGLGPQAAPLPAAAPPAAAPTAESADSITKALQVHDSYLIAETDEGMVVIDQHALHERILFEELRGRLERGGIEAQRLLVPEPVELSPADAAEILQRRDILARLGLEVEPFGGDTVLISSVPVMLRQLTPDQLLRDLADHFRDHELEPTPDGLLRDVLSLIACKAAIKANQPLSAEEIAALLARRHLLKDTHHCPHGRPTALTFSKAELERQFGRT